MSQTAVFVKLEDSEGCLVVQEILTGVPAEECIIVLALEEDMSGSVEATYEWYEVGDGESGMDFFFLDEELLTMYGNDGDDFIKKCEEKGYATERIQYGTISVTVEPDD